MRLVELWFVIPALTMACASTPAPDAIPNATEAPLTSAPPPTDSASPAVVPPIETPAVEKPFGLTATFDGDEVSVVGDTLYVLSRDYDNQSGKATVTAFELKGARFEKVGSRSFTQTGLEGVEAVVEERGTVYFSVVTAAGRSGNRHYEPIRGPGKSQNLGDVNSEHWERFNRLNPPSCGEPAVEGKAGMKASDDGLATDSHYFIIGEACEGGRTLQIVDLKKQQSRFMPIDASAYVIASNIGIALVSDQIGVWNGTEFVATATRPPTGTTFLFKGPDGALFATAPNENFVSRDKKWVGLALPDGNKKFALRQGTTSLWAFVGPSESSIKEVFKYLPAGATPPNVAVRFDDAAPSTGSVSAPPAPQFSKKPVGPKCKSNLVVLYGFTKVTPDDYDFPLTRKAIKGHSELGGVSFVVAEEGGKKYFIGKAPSFDKAKKLAKVIEDGVKGSKPQVVCSEPKVLRELAIDLVTGDVKRQ